MTAPSDTPQPDHHEHAKTQPRPDDEQLARLTERERSEVAEDQSAPSVDDTGAGTPS